MGPFNRGYGRTLGMIELSVEEMRNDPALLKRSGYEQVIDHPDVKPTLGKTVNRISQDLVEELGLRLVKALGDTPVYDRNDYINSPFSVPYYHSYVEGLDDAIWTLALAQWADGQLRHGYSQLHIVPYNDIYDGWRSKYQERRSGFMCSALSPFEYCFQFWEDGFNGNAPMKYYVPNLFDDGTFAVWFGILPQPASLVIEGRTAKISWAAEEPRVRRSNEMGRYTLPDAEREVEVKGYEWRHARALALVTALEKMTANEPADHYAPKMIAELEAKEAKFRRAG